MAGNKGITFAVAWGMTYAARKLKNYFPGSFFLLQNTGAILVLMPHQKECLLTDSNSNLIQYMGLEKIVFYKKKKKELYPYYYYYYFLSPMETN